MRGALQIVGVTKTFAGTPVVQAVDLDVRPGEFITLLGPSGCGKTTLLRLIAGFEQPDQGVVRISGRDVAALPPYKRPVNTVFQHYALFPHRSVAGNVAFGLEMARRPRAEIEARVSAALELVRLQGLAERRIEQLSGGQKQRVALARAMVLEPDVLLLDEPMAALDLKLRKEMQVEVKNLQERLGTTFVFVTHDQDEALVMSDRIAVMNQGRIEQVAAPEELYEHPRTRFVADFLAVRNVLACAVLGEATAGGVRLRTRQGLEIVAPGVPADRAGDEVWIGVRPERITLASAETRLATEADALCAEGVLDDELYLGDRTDWRVRVGQELLTVAEGAALASARQRGQRVHLNIARTAVLRLDAPRASRA